MKFAIAIEPGTAKTAFGVVVPDLPGCFSAGDTIEEAFEKTIEAIDLFVAEADGEIPSPKPMSEWQKKKEFAGWTWGIVDVPVEKYFGPAQKINITVPAKILAQIDEFAAKHGSTRSGFLVSAAEEKMRQSA